MSKEVYISAKEEVESVQYREREVESVQYREREVESVQYREREVESVQYRERGGGECALARKRRWRVCSIAKEEVESVQ